LLALLTSFAACTTLAPRVNFIPPDTPPPSKLESAVIDKNDTTGEPGIWMNGKDAKTLLKERVILRSIIEAYRTYWEKSKGK